jgi:hypothetical protein
LGCRGHNLRRSLGTDGEGLADPTRFERATSAFGVGSFTVVFDLDDLQLFEVSELSFARGDALLIYDLRPSALTGYPVVTPDFGADN